MPKLKIFYIGEDELECPTYQNYLDLFITIGKWFPEDLQFEGLVHCKIDSILQFFDPRGNTLLQEGYCFFPLLYVYITLAHVFKEITRLVLKGVDELQRFIIFEYLLCKVPSKIRGVTIAMEAVDDLHLLVQL